MSECVCIFVRFGCPVDRYARGYACTGTCVCVLWVIRRVFGDGVCIYMFALRFR